MSSARQSVRKAGHVSDIISLTCYASGHGGWAGSTPGSKAGKNDGTTRTRQGDSADARAGGDPDGLSIAIGAPLALAGAASTMLTAMATRRIQLARLHLVMAELLSRMRAPRLGKRVIAGMPNMALPPLLRFHAPVLRGAGFAGFVLEHASIVGAAGEQPHPGNHVAGMYSWRTAEMRVRSVLCRTATGVGRPDVTAF